MHHYTLEEKAAAVELVRGGLTYREASRACGIPHQRIWGWRRRLDAGGGAPYPLPRGKDRSERGAVVDMDRLPDDPEELKRVIREQRFEIDVTRAVAGILKKDPGVDPATLSNKEKATLVDALAERVYLSPVLDCFDSSLVGWKASTSERADDLTNPSLERAAERLGEGDRCVVHTDRGGQRFSSGRIGLCERFGVVRSMSRKGRSPDNARMEGFFGRLKTGFFDVRDWSGKGAGEFVEELDAWLRYHDEGRPKESLGWLSPMQYRRRHFEAA